MIVGKKFVWIHFPKTGGTLIEKILRKYYGSHPDLEFDPIDPDNVIWHQSIKQRRESTGRDLSDRKQICAIRRLPFWILSRIHYEARRSGVSTPREQYVKGNYFHMNRNRQSADGVLNTFLVEDCSWIRTENLKEDFFRVFSEYLDVSVIDPAEFDQIVNKTPYDSDLSEWFTPAELRYLYDSNPVWRDLEIKLYGGIIDDTYYLEHCSPVIYYAAKKEPRRLRFLNCSLVDEVNDEGFSILSENNDPQIYITVPELSPDKHYSVTIEIESPVDTKLQLFWQTHKNPKFTKVQPHTVNIKPGRRHIFLTVGPDLNGRLRVDPSMHPGHFTIRTLKIKEFNPASE